MSAKTQRIIGWVVSGLIAAFLLFSASGKLLPLMPADQKEEMLAHLGWAESTLKIIGLIELVVVALYLIPQTGFLGTILMTGYLGGAIATHVRVGDLPLLPFGMGVMAWVGYGLRNPIVFKLALGAYPTPPAA
ncbi:MAG: DoxX family protein [Gemmataceae bacterium]